MIALAAVTLLLSIAGVTVACWPPPEPPPAAGHRRATRRRHRWVAALWSGVAAGATLGACGGPTAGANPPPPAPVECFEDQPCWDCATMGNRQCGPAWPGPTCHGRPVPLDPRVSVRDPLGSLIYRAMLDTLCGPAPTEEAP